MEDQLEVQDIQGNHVDREGSSLCLSGSLGQSTSSGIRRESAKSASVLGLLVVVKQGENVMLPEFFAAFQEV